jgi:hypothetical protein
MKRNKAELNVDIIGGNIPLTNEEAKAISEYLQSKKAKKLRTKRSSAAKKEKAKA